MGVLLPNTSGGETSPAIDGRSSSTVAFLPRLKSWASCSKSCELAERWRAESHSRGHMLSTAADELEELIPSDDENEGPQE